MGRTGRKHGGNALQGRILFLFRQGAFRQSLLDGDLILRAGLPQLAPIPRLLRKSHNIAAGVLPSLTKLVTLSDYGRLMGLRSITGHHPRHKAQGVHPLHIRQGGPDKGKGALQHLFDLILIGYFREEHQ